MKNLHYLKKFVVMVLAAMMTLSTFAMPTFAAVDQADFTVKGLDQAAEVTAYKIVNISTEGNNRGAQSLVVPNSIEKIKEPKYDEIMALYAESQKTTGSKLTPIAPTTFTGGVATFKNAAPGMYLVAIKNKDDASVVYNPVVVTVNLKDGNGDAQAEEFTVGETTDYGKLVGGEGKLKKSTIPFEKVVDREAAKNGNKDTNVNNGQTDGDEASVNADTTDNVVDGNRGDTAGLGDTVWFRINTMVPDYADNFFKSKNSNIDKDPKFNIYDTLSDGLTLTKNSVKVYYYDETDVNDKKWVEADADWFTIPAASLTDRGFKVELTTDGILELRGKKVEVRYNAKVNGDHGYNYAAETNTGWFEYTRNPGGNCEKGGEKTTYHYTFTINGGIKGKDTDENREIIKIGTDVNGDFVLRETVAYNETNSNWRPLEGAEFKLLKKNDKGEYKELVRDPAMKIYSDKDGIIRGIDQIDAGEYQLVETKAPEGFAENTSPIPFRIKATLREDGRMTNYKVYVTGTDGTEFLVGDYDASYAPNQDPTNITPSAIEYKNTEAKNHSVTYKLHKKAVKDQTYMNEEGETKVAEGGEQIGRAHV